MKIYITWGLIDADRPEDADAVFIYENLPLRQALDVNSK